MQRLLIISRQQFGYLVDIYKWCEHLSEDYRINVVTFDTGKPKINLNKDNVKIHYISNHGNRRIRGLRYILVSLWYILKFRGLILVEYFKGCDIFKKVLPWKKMILDIRTLSIKQNKELRNAENNAIKNTSALYNFTTIISEGTRDAINLDKKKTAILPLGADIISKSDKKYDSLRLLYIGTLSGREIHKTVEGLSLYLKKNPNSDVHYDIIGDGYAGELEKLKELSKGLCISKSITFHGFVPHDKVHPFLEKCNIGVSYIPITEYYDHQPPTKTYEYILSGLYTIATNTYCNRCIINDNNGILIEDNAESFAESLTQINKKINTLKSHIIKDTLKDSTWETIVKYKLEHILKNL